MSTQGDLRSRWTPLTKMLMAGEMSDEPPRELFLRERIDRWMVNEGYRRLFVGVFILLHGMVFAFGLLNYSLKDNLTGARATFGPTYAIARSAGLVLHVDVALIMFPVCRNLISLLRRTPLNGIIQFGRFNLYTSVLIWLTTEYRQEHRFPQDDGLVHCLLFVAPYHSPLE